MPDDTSNPAAEAERLFERHDAMFQAAVNQANANQLEQAEEICRQILAADAQYPNALYMLGVLYCQRGRLDAGIEYLERLVRMEPTAAAPYFNLGNALMAQNRPGDAAAQYESALALEPENADIHINLGNAYKRLDRADDSEVAYRRALEFDPQNAIALNNLGNCLAVKKEFAEAEQLFRRAVAADTRFAAAENNLGNALKMQGRRVEAVAAYRRAIGLNGNYFEPLFSLGNTLSELGNFEAAEYAYRRATEVRPDHLDALINLASAVDALDRPAEVIRLCQRALTLAPDSDKALFLLANSYESSNRLDEAQQVVDRALKLHPDNPDVNLVAARIERRMGRYADGIARLEKRLPAVESGPMKQAYHFELGQLYDEENQCADALAQFTAGNELAKRGWDENNPGPNAFRQGISTRLDTFTPDWTASWKAAELPAAAGAPVFMVGFPRSGATLLERICGSHPQIKTLDEYPALAQVADELGKLPDGNPKALAALDAERIAALRNVYFSAVDQRISRRASYRIIDKSPLNLTDAGLIYRLFPEARFVFALRHPLDACLSCFMQNFRMTPATANFCELETTAATYADVMRLWQRYTEALPLQVHTVRYEALLDDFEGEVRKLLAFCDLEWDPQVLQFREQAGIAAPGAAHYPWQRYAGEIEPIRETLAPFVEAFGYSDEPGA